MSSLLDEITVGVVLANTDRNDYQLYVVEVGRLSLEFCYIYLIMLTSISKSISLLLYVVPGVRL